MQTHTIDTILTYLERAAAEEITIAPSKWVDGGLALASLLGTLHSRLCEQEQVVARLRMSYLEADTGKRNVSAAKCKVEASDEYLALRKMEMQCKQVEALIQLAKLRGRLADSEMRNH
jgi:hypothetical protein